MAGFFHPFAHIIHINAFNFRVHIGARVGMSGNVFRLRINFILCFCFLNLVHVILLGQGKRIFYLFPFLLLRQFRVGHRNLDKVLDVLVSIRFRHPLQFLELLALFGSHLPENMLHALAVLVTLCSHAARSQHAEGQEGRRKAKDDVKVVVQVYRLFKSHVAQRDVRKIVVHLFQVFLRETLYLRAAHHLAHRGIVLNFPIQLAGARVFYPLHECVHASGQGVVYLPEIRAEHAESIQYHFRLVLQRGRGYGFAPGFTSPHVARLLHMQVVVLVQVILIVLVQPLHGVAGHPWCSRGARHAQSRPGGSSHMCGKAPCTTETPEAELQQTLGNGVAAMGYGIDGELQHEGDGCSGSLSCIIPSAEFAAIISLHGQVDSRGFKQLLFARSQLFPFLIFSKRIVQQLLIVAVEHAQSHQAERVRVVAQAASETANAVFLFGFLHHAARLVQHVTGYIKRDALIQIATVVEHIVEGVDGLLHDIACRCSFWQRRLGQPFQLFVHLSGQLVQLAGSILLVQFLQFIIDSVAIPAHHLLV